MRSDQVDLRVSTDGAQTAAGAKAHQSAREIRSARKCRKRKCLSCNGFSEQSAPICTKSTTTPCRQRCVGRETWTRVDGTAGGLQRRRGRAWTLWPGSGCGRPPGAGPGRLVGGVRPTGSASMNSTPLIAFLLPVNTAIHLNNWPEALPVVALMAELLAVLVRSLVTPRMPCASTTRATDGTTHQVGERSTTTRCKLTAAPSTGTGTRQSQCAEARPRRADQASNLVAGQHHS